MPIITWSIKTGFRMFLIVTGNKKGAPENQTLYSGLIMSNTRRLRDCNTCESSSISDAVLENM